MSTTRSGRHELWGGVARGFIAVVAVLAVLVAAAAFIVPRFMGWVPLTILSGSMEPTYSPGDVVVVDPDYADPVIGDVVTVQPVSGDPTLVTHRIIGVTVGNDGALGVTTQGDANDAVDDPVTMEQIQGQVIYGVPWVGHLTQPEVRPWLGGAAIAILAWLVLSSILGGRGKDDEADDAEETDRGTTPPSRDDKAAAGQQADPETGTRPVAAGTNPTDAGPTDVDTPAPAPADAPTSRSRTEVATT
ncbi:signal peptidase I [Georgenia sp. Z1491]|uniref:signal peptidase I n=1 Tax=Georgenia sp. Z1491 TaxID=3416707 RepID=UPI003CE8E9ED